MEYINPPEPVYKEQIFDIFLYLFEIAGIENRGSLTFEKDFQKYLKFQKEADWKRLRAALDLLVDTDYAIQEAFKYQLGNKGSSTIGENYLRLYGVLNAVYLQMSAYKAIAMLLNYPNRNKIERDFTSLNIYKLRNLAAAHTLDFKFDNIIKSKTFRLLQSELDYSGNRIVMFAENGEKYEYNLLIILNEYDLLTTKLLEHIIIHAIEKLVFKHHYRHELKERLKTRLDALINYSELNKNL